MYRVKKVHQEEAENESTSLGGGGEGKVLEGNTWGIKMRQQGIGGNRGTSLGNWG